MKLDKNSIKRLTITTNEHRLSLSMLIFLTFIVAKMPSKCQKGYSCDNKESK